MKIDTDKYYFGHMDSITYEQFDNFVNEVEQTTKTWGLDLQGIPSREEYYKDFCKNRQNILLFNKENNEIVSLWTFMVDRPARAAETSTVVREGYRGENIGVFINLIGERYIVANYGRYIDNIYGRVLVPSNEGWANTLKKKLNYFELQIPDDKKEPGIIFVGRPINTWFSPSFFNKDLEIVEGVLK